jgi:putative oxidoreductase
MNAILGLGKYLFAVPFAVFGIMHLMNADAMAGMSPFGGSLMVYFTGVCLIAAAVSIFIGKYDKLATALLGLFMLLTALLIHAKGLAGADAASSATYMGGLLKDLSLAGAAWMYSASLSKDNSVIG